jgi:hypothetical protein
MSPAEPKETFFPRGAIASFIAMIVFYAVFWLGMYLLMASRA